MLSRWRDVESTLSMFNEFQRRMSEVFSDFEAVGPGITPSLGQSSWPPINIFDAGEQLVVRAQVPGMSAKDLQIQGHAEMLTVRGERRDETPKGYVAHRQERGTIQFSRSFTLPCKVDLERTTAVVVDGILTVNLTKAPEAKPRQIAIKG